MLQKVDDEHAGSPTGLTEKYLTSIKTGRTMDEIAAGKKAKELHRHPGEGRDPGRDVAALHETPAFAGAT